MNEQEMQFADPDWQPKGSLPRPQENAAAGPPPVQSVNTRSSYDVSQDSGMPSYEQGYRASPGGYTPYTSPVLQQTPMRQVSGARRRSARWLWLLVVIIALFLFSSMSHSFNLHQSTAFPGFQGPGPMPPQGFAYGLKNVSHLAINDLSSSVTVRVEDIKVPEIVVQPDNETSPDISRTPDEMSVNLNDSGDVTVLVPRDAALSLTVVAGTVEVDGFVGQISAQTVSGSITLRQDVLRDQSSLNSQTGNIMLDQDKLSGQVTVQTSGRGDISFNGTLDSAGTYQFETEDGDITLQLPADTAMQVSPVQGTGTYQSDFANPAGNEPGAAVTVKTSSGNIRIHQD